MGTFQRQRVIGFVLLLLCAGSSAPLLAAEQSHPWSTVRAAATVCARGLLVLDWAVAEPIATAIQNGIKSTRRHFDVSNRLLTNLNETLESARKSFVDAAGPRVRVHLSQKVLPAASDVFLGDFDPDTDLVFLFESNSHSIVYLGHTRLDYVGGFVVRDEKRLNPGLLAKVRLPLQTMAKLKQIVAGDLDMSQYKAGSCQHAELSVLLQAGIKPAGGASLSGLTNFKAIVLKGFEDEKGNLMPSEVVYAHSDQDKSIEPADVLNGLYFAIQAKELEFLYQGITYYGITQDDLKQRIDRLAPFSPEFRDLNQGDHFRSYFSAFVLAKLFMSKLSSRVRGHYGLSGDQLLPLVVNDFNGVDRALIRHELLGALDDSIHSLLDGFIDQKRKAYSLFGNPHDKGTSTELLVDLL